MTIEMVVQHAVKSALASATAEQIHHTIHAPYADVIAVMVPAYAA